MKNNYLLDYFKTEGLIWIITTFLYLLTFLSEHNFSTGCHVHHMSVTLLTTFSGLELLKLVVMARMSQLSLSLAV
jgi:hypothetical protein